MATFYLNRNQQENSGDYEVHETGCTHGAEPQNQIDLGWHTDSFSAVSDAKRRFPQHASDINGCYWCCLESHTS